MSEENKNQPGGETNGAQPLTFDELLKDKDYQSEFDTRVSKALTTAKVKWAADMEVKNKAEKEALAQELAGKEKAWNDRLIKAEATGTIAKYRAKDPADILPLLDMTRVSMKDDKLEGLEDQIKALKESKGYLFESEGANQKNASTGFEHGNKVDEKAEEETILANLGLSKNK